MLQRKYVKETLRVQGDYVQEMLTLEKEYV
jgi:hypothetical protein